jgi:antitoxin (DNA-binding transcriptional repressor) of toxin-antitoxin stability system
MPLQKYCTIYVDKIVHFQYNNSTKYGWEVFYMSITATELKANLSKYLLLSATEDVFITRNGKVISKLTNPFQERVEAAKSLFGVIPDNITLEQVREERLNKL